MDTLRIIKDRYKKNAYNNIFLIREELDKAGDDDINIGIMLNMLFHSIVRTIAPDKDNQVDKVVSPFSDKLTKMISKEYTDNAIDYRHVVNDFLKDKGAKYIQYLFDKLGITEEVNDELLSRWYNDTEWASKEMMKQPIRESIGRVYYSEDIKKIIIAFCTMMLYNFNPNIRKEYNENIIKNRIYEIYITAERVWLQDEYIMRKNFKDDIELFNYLYDNEGFGIYLMEQMESKFKIYKYKDKWIEDIDKFNKDYVNLFGPKFKEIINVI